MPRKSSPPRRHHRHDGASPLPLGMDWRPAPNRWLKKAFPRKGIRPAPPKHAVLRINSNRLFLEEGRHALEEWMAKLLSDIELSRSSAVANFLDLEATARSFFHGGNKELSETSFFCVDTALHVPVPAARSSSITSFADCTTVPAENYSVVSVIAGENAYEIADAETHYSTVQMPEELPSNGFQHRNNLSE